MMKIPPTVRPPCKRTVVLACAGALLAIISPLQASNPPVSTSSCTSEKQCNCQGEGTKQGLEHKSLYWWLNLGRGQQEKDTSFTDMSRTGALEGALNGMPRDFDSYYSQQFSGDPVNRLPILLELDVPRISADVFDPGTLQIHNTAKFKRIDDQGRIRQVLTDDALTNIDSVAGGGFRVRLWNRQGLALVKDGNLYNIPAGDPVVDTTFRKPDGFSGDNELLVIMRERLGSNGVHILTEHHVQDAANDRLTVTTYEGEGTAGTALRQEVLQYSNRGAKTWDHTIERRLSGASTAVDGTMGGLVETSHTLEV